MLQRWKDIADDLQQGDVDAELLKARLNTISRQVPLMCATLLIGMWALSWSFAASASIQLTALLPAALTLLASFEILRWRRKIREGISERATKMLLRDMSMHASVFAIAFAIWSISLFLLGNDLQRANIAFFIAIALVVGTNSLTATPSAAIFVVLLGNLAFLSFYLLTQNIVFVSMAGTVLIVSFFLLLTLAINYRHLVSHVVSRSRIEKLGLENSRLAKLDSLTEVPNRRHLFDELTRGIARSGETGNGLALAVLDLDRFKSINDLYGHSTGDRLLVMVADRIQRAAGEGVFVARLGGDEFALAIENPASDSQLIDLGKQVMAALDRPFDLYETQVSITASIGIATYPDLVHDEHDLFDCACYALYEAKAERQGKIVLFSARHREQMREDAWLERAMREDDFDSQLSVDFQPIVNVETGRTIAFEALGRWRSPEKGPISPISFIRVAERTGLIGRLTKSLLTKALTEAVGWPDHVRLSFNLSPNDIASKSSMEAVLAAVGKSGIDPARLDFEITETAIVTDSGEAGLAAEAIRRLGCGLSLDDFGTGFSSLTRLHAYPISKIKIDRSFIMDLGRKQTASKIVKSILSLANDMGLECIVEGVETEEQLQKVYELGGRLIQGYYFSAPIPAAAIRGFLDNDAKILQPDQYGVIAGRRVH